MLAVAAVEPHFKGQLVARVVLAVGATEPMQASLPRQGQQTPAVVVAVLPTGWVGTTEPPAARAL